MPTNHTEHYNLSQWERTDKVLMEDFNADNAKIDGALAELAGAAAGKGNCQIVCGRYCGTDLAGKSHPNTLTFDHKPMAVLIQPEYSSIEDEGQLVRMLLIRGSRAAFANFEYRGVIETVTWGDKSVSWYANSKDSGYQFNYTMNYCYVALLAADE